ncbi:hypothetical protein FRC19_009523, partial [Serendipita sp. 401]
YLSGQGHPFVSRNPFSQEKEDVDLLFALVAAVNDASREFRTDHASQQLFKREIRIGVNVLHLSFINLGFRLSSLLPLAPHRPRKERNMQIHPPNQV